MIAYCQASPSATVLALAGVLASREDWAAFEPRWRQMLGPDSALTSCLLLPELFAGKGAFAAECGWELPRRLHLLRRALRLAHALAPPEFRAFACAVDLECYRSLESFDDLLISPERLCHYFVPRQILAWCAHELPLEQQRQLDFAFDSKQPFLSIFAHSLEKNRAARPASRGPRDRVSWLLARETVAIDLRQSIPAQLAGLFAWSVQVRFSGAAPAQDDPFTAALREEGFLEPFQFTPVDAARLHQLAWVRFPTEFLSEEWP